MDAERDALVAGLFESQQQADVAVASLHRIGVSDAEVEIGAPEPGRYRIEYHESSRVWKGVRNGMLMGAVVGSLISMAIMAFAVPWLKLAGWIELSVPMGAFWGVFFGGLTGMAMRAATSVQGEPRYTVTNDSDDVLVIVHAGTRFGAVHDVMEHQHPRYLLADVPAVHHASRRLAATG